MVTAEIVSPGDTETIHAKHGRIENCLQRSLRPTVTLIP